MEQQIKRLLIRKHPTFETFISIRITHNNVFQKYQQN